MVAQFGDEILAAGTMEIDRKRLAEIVFSDRNKLAALNAIVHPVILSGMADHLERLRATDDVVVIDAALLVDLGVTDLLDTLVVVTASEDVRRERLRGRGMRQPDIDARMSAQVPQEALVQKADLIVSNDGSLEDLVAEADRAWLEIHNRR